MSFFIRVWVIGEEIPFINSREDEIKFDMVNIKDSVVIDAEVKGAYLDAGEIRDIITVENGRVSLANKEVLNQSVSTR